MKQFFYLKKGKKTYKIKVRSTQSDFGLVKIYYQNPDGSPSWVNFATCMLGDNIEQTILLYFGNKGQLTLID